MLYLVELVFLSNLLLVFIQYYMNLGLKSFLPMLYFLDIEIYRVFNECRCSFGKLWRNVIRHDHDETNFGSLNRELKWIIGLRKEVKGANTFVKLMILICFNNNPVVFYLIQTYPLWIWNFDICNIFIIIGAMSWKKNIEKGVTLFFKVGILTVLDNVTQIHSKIRNNSNNC